MYCIKCGKQIEIKEAEKYENFCKKCYKNTAQYKSKNKKRITSLLLSILVILLIGIVLYIKFPKLSKEAMNIENYKVNVEKISIATLNDDDAFYKDLKDDYKGFKLLFISAEIKNSSQQNYNNLSYKLLSSNNNEYGSKSSFVTKEEEFIENYYKINNKIFNDSTNNLLGGKSKRIILGFMVSESEIMNDTKFKLIVSSFDLKNTEVEKLEFSSNEIIRSYTMKELYKENEIEKAEQTISLAYFSSINDWMSWIINFEQAYNYKYDDLFTVAFTALNEFAKSADYNYGWNGRKVDKENGSKLDFEKAKEYYPEISKEIEGTKNAINEIKKLHKSYKNYIGSLDANKLQKMDSDIIVIDKIKDYFGLTYYRY